MSTIEFEDLLHVAALEARGEATHEAAEWLRSPENVGQWITALTDIVRDLSHQSLALTEEDEEDKALAAEGRMSSQVRAQRRADRASRKRRMARFRQGIETRLSEARRLEKQHNRDHTESENHTMRYVYREAIKAHRRASRAGGFEPEDHDLELWAVLTENACGQPPSNQPPSCSYVAP